ncbi:tetratricopeptide repeat protein [Leptospira santarosai str. HAI134]|nr:tetratricopeptide repeat protein [Leptospira santarosai str. HAI134]
MISETMKQTIQFYNEGLSFYKTRKFTEALEKFKKAVELTPPYISVVVRHLSQLLLPRIGTEFLK